MRATVPFLAAGMAVLAAASCGSPSSGDSNDGLPVSGSGGQGNPDSGASGTDSGISFGAAGSTAGTGSGSGGSNAGGSGQSGGSTGTSGAGGSQGGGGAGTGGGGPAACSAFSKDCDGDTSNGCETDISSDANNCGACATKCTGAAHATGSCFVGKCDFACDSGWADCNTTASDGCEQDLSSDANNCGACGMVCQNTNCVNRACQCGSTTTVPPKIPLDMFIMFDQSGSMNDDVTGGTKWNVIKGALTTFVNSPGAVGMRVGIGFFPVRSANAGGGGGFCIGSFCIGGGSANGTVSCNWLDYAVPAVGIDAIPAVSQAIIDSLNNHGPGGDTPTYPALQGSYDYAKIWATANPNRKTIVVLATDGNPTNCDQNNVNNVPNISTALVAPARAGNPSLLTFVIGVGSSLTNLNQIANSGGTGQAFIVDTAGADPGGQFLAAMQAIQGSAALGCEYGMPTAPGGASADKTKVNVQFTPLNGSPTTLKKVLDEASCDPSTGGWHYDNEAAPTKIQLCNSSCTAIQSFSGAKVEVLLGCASVG
jgi:hypothetical protein